MPRQLSANAFRAMFAQETSEVFLTCLTIEHASLAQPIRAVYNNEAITRLLGSTPVHQGWESGHSEGIWAVGNQKQVSKFTFTDTTTLSSYKFWCGYDNYGNGGATLATIKHKVVIYNADALWVAGSLVYQSPEFTGITVGLNTKTINTTLPPGNYLIGLIQGATWSISGTSGIAGQVNSYYNSDTYSDGPSSPFGQQLNQGFNIYAVVDGTSNTYGVFQPAAFDIDLPEENAEQVPTVTLSFDNVDRAISDAIRSVVGRPKVTLEIVLASSPDTVEAGPFIFSLMDSQYDASKVDSTLGLEDDILNTAFPKDKFTPTNSPGLFS